MTRKPLVRVADTFQFDKVGLIIYPTLSVPEAGWQARDVETDVNRPDGSSLVLVGRFELSHLNIRDASSTIDQRWHITIIFRDTLAESVPVGSVIYAPCEVVDLLTPGRYRVIESAILGSKLPVVRVDTSYAPFVDRFSMTHHHFHAHLPSGRVLPISGIAVATMPSSGISRPLLSLTDPLPDCELPTGTVLYPAPLLPT